MSAAGTIGKPYSTALSVAVKTIAMLLTSMQSVVARAAPASPPAARLEVVASADCSSREAVAARVLARSPGIRFADDATALSIEARFTVLRTGKAGKVVGELTLAGPGAEASSRRVVARSCEQATEAVALIIAVTLDPNVLERGGTPPSDAPASDPARAPARAPVNERRPPRPESKPDAQRTEGERERDRASESSNVAPLGATVASVPRFGGHVAAVSLFGPAPEILPGIGGYAIAGLDREALWSPTIVLGAFHARRGGIEEPGGTAAFSLDAASADLCPLRLRLSEFDARPCASMLVGRLSATGSDTRNSPGTVSRPFAATGVAAVLTLRIHPIIELSGRAGLGFSLVRDSFEFGTAVFHRVSPVVGIASVGIGLRSR